MTFTGITCDLGTPARFDVLLCLVERFSKQPRSRWGCSSAEIETARQAIVVITAGRHAARYHELSRWTCSSWAHRVAGKHRRAGGMKQTALSLHGDIRAGAPFDC